MTDNEERLLTGDEDSSGPADEGPVLALIYPDQADRIFGEKGTRRAMQLIAIKTRWDAEEEEQQK